MSVGCCPVQATVPCQSPLRARSLSNARLCFVSADNNSGELRHAATDRTTKQDNILFILCLSRFGPFRRLPARIVTTVLTASHLAISAWANKWHRVCNRLNFEFAHHTSVIGG